MALKNLVVKLADIEGVPHGSASARTNVEVTARYTSVVTLADGRVIPQVITMKPLRAPLGTATFEVYASDDPDVKTESRGFAIVVEATINGTRGKAQGRLVRTVKPMSSMPATIQFGTLAPAEPIPPGWGSVGEVIGDFDSRIDVLEARPLVLQDGLTQRLYFTTGA